jgi:hypothetical protein
MQSGDKQNIVLFLQLIVQVTLQMKT